MLYVKLNGVVDVVDRDNTYVQYLLGTDDFAKSFLLFFFGLLLCIPVVITLSCCWLPKYNVTCT